MSSASSFFGGQKPSPFITNPKHLPIAQSKDEVGGLSLKTGLATTVISSSAGFFTSLGTQGAVGAITAADTYTTLCDLTGAGFMGVVVAPTHTGSFTPSVEVTVDGVVYTISPTGALAANSRLVLGATTNGPSAQALTSGSPLANSYSDPGFAYPRVGGVHDFQGLEQCIATPNAMLAYAMPVLRFESSLKVRVKASLLSATADHKKCGVTYRLDI